MSIPWLQRELMIFRKFALGGLGFYGTQGSWPFRVAPKSGGASGFDKYYKYVMLKFSKG